MSNYCLIRYLPTKNADDLKKTLVRALRDYRKTFPLYTITSDNGKEFACHLDIAKALTQQQAKEKACFDDSVRVYLYTMNIVYKLLFSFVFAAFFVLACSDNSSDSSDVDNLDVEQSSSSEILSSETFVDTFVEYVEPPTLSCEPVESIQFESSTEQDTSFNIISFGFYGDDLIAIPRHFNMRGLYGHEDDPAVDTFYVKKNGSSSWQKYAAFEHYLYKQEGHNLCIVGDKLALVRSGGYAPNEGRELCHSEDARNWTCDSVQGDIHSDFWLTCDDKYFYKSENDKLYYSEDASVWNPIAFDFTDGIHSVYDAFSNDSAHLVLVGYWHPIRNDAGETVDVGWRTALLHSRDMVTWDTTYMMEGVGWSLARIGDVYVSSVGWGGSGFLYYSKDLKNWTRVNLVNGDYRAETEMTDASMVVSNGTLVAVGGRYVFASRNGKDFKVQETCKTKDRYVDLIVDSQGAFYALWGDMYGGKYNILRVVE